MKNRLYGDASIYKPLLEREHLTNEDTGVTYFKNSMRPHFVKGTQGVFLWRFYQFLRCYRGQMDMLRWIGRLCVIKKRVQDSWMDLFPAYTIDDDRFIRDYTDLVNRRGTHIDVNQAFADWLVRRRNAHTQSFPINDNLFALMVTVQADLSEQQRETCLRT